MPRSRPSITATTVVSSDDVSKMQMMRLVRVTQILMLADQRRKAAKQEKAA